MRSIAGGLLLAFIFATTANAQGGGLDGTTSFGGRNSIVGTVYLKSDRSIVTHIKMVLSSMKGHEASTFTDQDGKYVFPGIGNGSYTISIENSNDFEPSIQQLDIDQMRGSIPQTFPVNFYLIPKRKPAGKPKAINVENVAVPKKALELYEGALALSFVGDHKGAVAQLKLAVAEYPAFMLALTEMGVQYLKLNELEKADEALQAALKIKPDAYEPLVNRGIVKFKSKQYAEAETFLRSSLKAKEQSAVAHFYLGRTFASQKQYETAEMEFRTAIKIGGEQMREAHRMLASMFLELEDHKQALSELEIYLKLNPSAPDAEQLNGVVRELRTLIKERQ